MFFYSCHYLDKDGDEISRGGVGLATSLLIHKADGRIYNADDLPWYVLDSNASYLGDGGNNMYATNNNHIIKITISGDECTWQQITPDNSPINIWWSTKLFKMNSGAVAAVSPVGGSPSSLAIIYPQGGYDWFTEHSPYVALSDGFIEFDEPAKYVSVGSAYGQLTETILSEDAGIGGAVIAYHESAYSWYDMGDKALMKILSGTYEKSISYYLFDRASASITLTDIDFGDDDLIELWNENLYKGRLYGLVGSNNHYNKIAWINPTTLDYGTIDIGLANEIDITYIAPDYSHGKIQMTGTRRSDGYNVAIDLDITTGRYTTMFSDPNRQITALVPLN